MGSPQLSQLRHQPAAGPHGRIQPSQGGPQHQLSYITIGGQDFAHCIGCHWHGERFYVGETVICQREWAEGVLADVNRRSHEVERDLGRLLGRGAA